MKIDEETFGRLEWCLYHYFMIKDYVNDIQNIIYYASPAERATNGDKESRYSDPTASKVIKIDECLYREKTLVKIIEDVIKRFKDMPEGTLLQKKYFDELGTRQILHEMSIDKDTYMRYRTKILEYMADVAIIYGVLHVEHPEELKGFLKGIMSYETY